MTQTETDDKQMENLKDQLDVLLWLKLKSSIITICSLHLSSFERKQCNESKVHLLTLDIPEGFLVSSIIVVYSGCQSKVIIHNNSANILLLK